MRYLFIFVFLLAIVSIDRFFVQADLEEEIQAEPTWARTYPPRPSPTTRTRPPPISIERNTTKALVRVSDSVTIGVSVALFAVTLGVGFTLLALVILQVGRNRTRVEKFGP